MPRLTDGDREILSECERDARDCEESRPTQTVRCAVCAGSGSELVLCPDGSLGVKSCFWCDGTGEIDSVDPGVCPRCTRPMVAVTPDEGVCPECTQYLPVDLVYGDERDYDF